MHCPPGITGGGHIPHGKCGKAVKKINVTARKLHLVILCYTGCEFKYFQLGFFIDKNSFLETGGRIMKWHTDYHWVSTSNKREFINITGLVSESVKKAGIKEGMALVSAMHITSVY